MFMPMARTFVPFLFGKPFLLAYRSQGCQSGHTGTYEHALCMMIEKLVRQSLLFVLNTSLMFDEHFQ